jgi:uncharacterized membrane protein YdjX (TVP38/TMEM64 family)
MLAPFFLFEASLQRWTTALVQSATERGGLTALVLGLLLASDVLLPIPSSMVSTAAGALLGVLNGTCVSVLGMSVASCIGYGLGRSAGRTTAQYLIGIPALQRLEKLGRQYGQWTIVLVRSLPVLAEASTLFAGMSRMPFRRFLLVSVLSNVGISLVYATIGRHAVQVNSFLCGFAGAVVVPLVALLFLQQKREDASI